ncbi:MAG TPA: acyl-CoA desaturase [Verrucomicrobiae bacterium]|jgi:stearoyl-CoA desaturase (delta-9 desaturase)
MTELKKKNLSPLRRLVISLIHWFDADYGNENFQSIRAKPDKVEWARVLPFILLHAGCVGVFLSGWSWTAIGAAVFFYLLRMFAVTGFYHRYFSHKTFHTSRAAQFLFAVLGATAVQRGPLWWSYQHRHHHKHSDDDEDEHSPTLRGFWWSHIGWITSGRNFPTDYSQVRDLARFPELVFLNRFDSLVPFLFAVFLFGLGHLLHVYLPSLGVTSWQMLVWGFFISTTVLFHATSSINSLAHLLGKRRYETEDNSRNSLILALITLGEGWHNNHHRYMNATRQGFYWWEIDISYGLLKALSWTGLIWGLKPVPLAAYENTNRISEPKRVSTANRHRA